MSAIADVLIGFGVGAVLAAIVQAVSTRRKVRAEATKAGAEAEKANAEATQVLTAAAAALVAPLEHRIGELSTEVEGLRAVVAQAATDLAASHAREVEKDRVIAKQRQMIAELARAGAGEGDP